MNTFQQENQQSWSKINYLREKIEDKAYLYEGIVRIAKILSEELVDSPQRGDWYEQQRQRGK
ncbi:MAG: hypothetical protein LBL19_03590 [Spirochaetaceae bacterium]|jgi:hypothetical protein|nr:hypothetical protein [Spirochaetaceae bacterium]